MHVRSLTLKYDLRLSQCSGMEKVKTVECLYAALSHSPVLVISLVTLSVFPFPDEVRNGYTF